MMKKIFVLITCLGLVFHLSGCTSSDTPSDAEVTSDFDSADLEQLEGSGDLEFSDSAMASDQLPEDALGETASPSMDEPVPDAMMDSSIAEAAPTMDALPEDPFAEAPGTTTADEMAPPATETPADTYTYNEPETTPSYDSSESNTTYVDEPAEKPVKKNIPLQKMADAPWKVGKSWFNTLYVARPGDSLASISQMIYGNEGRVDELKKGNPTFQRRGVKPGDKVYYNSPLRPDDSSRVVTYYEDNGMAPETYVSQEGENIRTLSKNLLGYPNAWKEVWATNMVDSKGDIPAGTELRYWRGGAVAAAQPVAPRQEVAAALPIPAEEPPMPQEMEMPPTGEVPSQDMAQMDESMMMPPEGDMAPPPPPDMVQDQFAAPPPPPPPPPPVEAVNPPAPMQAEGGDELAPGMDNDTTMALAVVGLSAAALAILIVMRKKRKQRELEQQMDNTHVG